MFLKLVYLCINQDLIEILNEYTRPFRDKKDDKPSEWLKFHLYYIQKLDLFTLLLEKDSIRIRFKKKKIQNMFYK